MLSNYIVNNFIDNVDDDTKSIDFLKQNVLFANNYKVNFDLDAESIMSKIRNEVDENANIIFGSSIDNNLEGIIKVSVVATGINRNENQDYFENKKDKSD